MKRIPIWLPACKLEWCFRPFDFIYLGVLLWTSSSPWASTTRFPWRSMLSMCHCLTVLKRFSKSPHFLSEMAQMMFRWPKKVQVSPLAAFEVHKNPGPPRFCGACEKHEHFVCNGRVSVPYVEFSSWYSWSWNWPLNGTKCHGWLVDIPQSYTHHPALTNIWFEGTSGHGSAALNCVQLDFGIFFGVISLGSFSSPLIPIES